MRAPATSARTPAIPDQVFIDAGRGEGVIDRLRQLGYSIVEVNFGGKASDPNAYVNKQPR